MAFVSEDTRRSFGLRHARARASAETEIATAARELIDLVDGAAYLTQEVRAVELAEALEDLMTAHDGYNNFYAEGAPARQIEAIVGDQGAVPEPVQDRYIKTLVQVFLGNGYGVSFAAEPIYRRLLQRLDGTAAGVALREFRNPVVSSLLWSSMGRTQWAALLDTVPKGLTDDDRK